MQREATGFPPGFFSRMDETEDSSFYENPRIVTHIDERAVAEVGRLYRELGVDGKVLDVCSSWVSHFLDEPVGIVAVGMNPAELAANEQAIDWLCLDLNADPTLPFDDDQFDDAVCCVSVDYLVHPVAVFREVARVTRPGGRFVVTFSNRCFPTKAVAGWLHTDDGGHIEIVRRYFALSGCFSTPSAELRTPAGSVGDPLYAMWASVLQEPDHGAAMSPDLLLG